MSSSLYPSNAGITMFHRVVGMDPIISGTGVKVKMMVIKPQNLEGSEANIMNFSLQQPRSETHKKFHYNKKENLVKQTSSSSGSCWGVAQIMSMVMCNVGLLCCQVQLQCQVSTNDVNMDDVDGAASMVFTDMSCVPALASSFALFFSSPTLQYKRALQV